MCAPEHFGVEYVINPWMEGNVGQASSSVACRQWRILHDTLARQADVALLQPVAGLPDMCFTANGGFVIDTRFVPSVFSVVQRAPEVAHVQAWFEAQGFQVLQLSQDHPFEGEGDALLWPSDEGSGLLWAGYGVRTGLQAHRELCELLNLEVISLRLVDERFYHLDTCFLPLPDARVMYYPAAFDEASLQRIRSRVPAERRLEIGHEDAAGFACNAIRLGSTLVLNQVSEALARRLRAWGYEPIVVALSEFLKAGGAAKCLALLLAQESAAQPSSRPPLVSPIRNAALEMQGHLLDTGKLNSMLDVISVAGGSFTIDQLRAGGRRDQPSYVRLSVSAPDEQCLESILERLRGHGANVAHEVADARLVEVRAPGVAPRDFYSTTIYPTSVRVQGQWLRVQNERMDGVIVVSEEAARHQARCVLMRDLQVADRVVCGVEGVRVRTPDMRRAEAEFGFMTAAASSERRVAGAIEELALEMRRLRARGGRTVVVAGPVVVHTGAGPSLARLIRAGYVQALLTGNALPVHDIESNLYGTSLGVNLRHGVGVEGGHQHHLRAINTIREAGSIRAAVEQGILSGGVMFECVRQQIPYVLAGSIRDDGPLPETVMDLIEAQREYARAIRGADLVLMLSSMLHAIATGNMTPAGVHLVCVDINPSVVTKLADRGSVESTGIVTDVGLFLDLLARSLCPETLD
ncbi:MAG: TIGR00300 family protein [Gammaproteobacteria bacterium]|nr:TIGR00300 family protein [Gammaproteobacteria bacterium]